MLITKRQFLLIIKVALFRWHTPSIDTNTTLCIVIICILIVILDELHCSYCPEENPFVGGQEIIFWAKNVHTNHEPGGTRSESYKMSIEILLIKQVTTFIYRGYNVHNILQSHKTSQSI